MFLVFLTVNLQFYGKTGLFSFLNFSQLFIFYEKQI